jgi:hypothetical protein
VAAKRTNAASIRAERHDQDAPSHAPRQGEKLRGGSQAEPTSHFFQGDIVAGFRPGLIQLGRCFGIDDLLLTEFARKEMATCTSLSGRASTND